MKKSVKPVGIAGLLLGLLFLCAEFGKREKSSGVAKYTYCKTNNSLLWEITGNGLKQPSYLYGTIHIQRKEVFAYDDVVKAIFDSCRAYAMEINMADVSMAEMEKMMKLEKPLDSLVSAGKVHSLDSLLQVRAGTSIDKFRNTKPFFLTALLMKNDIGSDTQTPLDFDFYAKAQSAHKKLFGIEKFAEQMEAVNTLTVEEQVDMLLEGYRDTTSSFSMFDDLLKLYLQQDLEAIMKMMLKDESFPVAFNEAFITKRNQRMADRIADISAKRMTFNAIGAAHLPGPGGVIQLLKNKGYTLKPVKFTFKESKSKK